MPYPIKRPVIRQTRYKYRVLYASGSKAKPIVVTILPGDVLEFRESRGRARFTLAIDTAFKYAVKLAALKEAGEKGRKKIERKKQRARK